MATQTYMHNNNSDAVCIEDNVFSGKILNELALHDMKLDSLEFCEGVYLRSNFANSTLNGISIRNSNMSMSGFYEATLHNMYMGNSSLVFCRFVRTTFNRGSVSNCNFSQSVFNSTHIIDVDLSGCIFTDAVFDKVIFERVRFPNPQALLRAYWRNISDDLITDLMNYDASSHSNSIAFSEWANGGLCPYLNDSFDGRIRVDRASNFNERRDLWKPNRPLVKPIDLLMRLFEERGCKVIY